MPEPTGYHIGAETIKDFFDEYDEMYDLVIKSSEKIVDADKKDEAYDDLYRESVDSLFRGLHSIKSNLSMVGLTEISHLVNHLENILEHVRLKAIPYSTDMGDVIKLALEESRIYAEDALKNKKNLHNNELPFIINAIKQICVTDETKSTETLNLVLNLLDPFKNKADKKAAAQATKKTTYPYIEQDLNFFQKLSDLTEERLKTNRNRISLIKTIALEINTAGGNKVDKTQLTAAILLSNWGLSLLPIDVQNKDMLSDKEQKEITNFPSVSAQLLDEMPFWKPARKIIMQCHEHPDGTGFPNNLTAKNICSGANILYISQSFISILHSRPYQHLSTRTIMSGIMEMNKGAGTQFDDNWINIFNYVIKKLHEEDQLI